MPLNSKDNTVNIFQETLKYVPPDDRLRLAEDVIQAGTHKNLHQISQSIHPVTGMREWALQAINVFCQVLTILKQRRNYHILPFALADFKTNNERRQTASIWMNIFWLNFYCEHISCMENVMMLSQPLHKQFGQFSFTLEPTETVNQYCVKTFCQFLVVFTVIY